MVMLAISGHRGLSDSTSRLVDAALRAELARHDSIVGISCLADGADQLFAKAVLDAGGNLVVVVPADEYRQALPESCHDGYDRLFGQATKVVQLRHVRSDSQAHMEASAAMLDLADQLVAVWDGQPARGYGGTADVVKLAQDRAMPVVVVWPEGASRD